MPLESATKTEKLLVKKYPSVLCFEQCCEKNIPLIRSDVKQVICTLKAFSNHQVLNTKNVHPLEKRGDIHNTDYLFSKFPEKTLWSVDVYHRNGQKGGYRLIYYREPSDENIGKIVAVFVDTHH